MLKDELYTKPGHLIRRMQQIAVAIFMEECAGFDLTPVQYAALVAIRAHPGIDATRLSALVAFDRSTLGSVIGRLEAKDFIRRRPSPEDSRVKLLSLSERGEKTLAAAESAVERAQERIVAPLRPPEQKKLIQLLTQLVHLSNETSRAPQRLGGTSPESNDLGETP